VDALSNIIPRRVLSTTLLFFALLGASVCCQSPVNGAEGADALLSYPDATGVWSGSVGQTSQLRYHVNARYPAGNVIDFISSRLREAGWKPLAYDFLNPTLPASRLMSWEGDFLESLKHPDVCVHMWTGNWKNDSGDVVRYILRYKHHGCGTSDLTDLEVIGVYFPASVARQTQQIIERSKGKPGPR
jgi:hypothetical protein